MSVSSSSLVKEVGKTPQKIVRSISKAVGKKLLAMQNVTSAGHLDEEDCVKDCIGPKFEMIASVTLKLDDCSNGELVYDGKIQNILLLNFSKNIL